MSDDLEPLAPGAGRDLYLDHRRGEVSENTLSSHRYRLNEFVDWCEEQGIHNLNDLTGRDLHAYRVYRREEDDLKIVSLQGQLSTLRVFLKFCTSIDAVPDGLHEKILLPTVSGDKQASKTLLEPERAQEILEYLETYQYASRQHVLLTLLWQTGLRMGSTRAIDLGDYDPDAPGVELVHRPEQDTPLKNKERGERWVALRGPTATVIDEYIAGPRRDMTDEYGRDPLLTTAQGRVSTSAIQGSVYTITRPCEYGECPHDDFEPETCEFTKRENASKCPSSRSPHDVRSGAITAHLLDDVPVEIVSDRMDVTQSVLDRHYDRRSEREKMEKRRKFIS
ncbi:tyrosine-type recombinase/integrase [Halovenus salina]|uniref:Tyrosine-type recombinase/integrase n=1 Tax=Halovenus salina TaxID=1510225 RepID=A0ABD5W0K8_9EURY|nr:site-specific integrase [Halovenus salina]